MVNGDGDVEIEVADGTVTRAVLGGPPGARLVDDAASLTQAEFAAAVRSAGAGLACRGLRRGDTGAVLVSGAADFAVAVHAVAATGAAALPLAAAPAVDLGRTLARWEVRVLIAAPALAGLAVAAVEYSSVRQVITFGSVPGTTAFADLSTTIPQRRNPAPVDPLNDLALCCGEERFTHARWLDHLGTLPELEASDVVVAVAADCSPVTWIGLIDMAVTRGATFVAVASPDELPAAMQQHGGTVAVLADGPQPGAPWRVGG
ncbi:MAG: AMP-binding protein, partial [Streptosporangiaceae bacterium]